DGAKFPVDPDRRICQSGGDGAFVKTTLPAFTQPRITGQSRADGLESLRFLLYVTAPEDTMSLYTWLALLQACCIITLSPGAGAVASMASGLNYGFARGYWNAIGLQLDLLMQIAIVAAGVGALLAASALGFALIKWFGVGYLLYLGYRQWHAPVQEMRLQHRPIGRPLSLVLRGFIVNASNPKAIVFILAVLPQFLDPARPL